MRSVIPLRLPGTTIKPPNLHFEPDEYLALLSPTTRHSILDPYLGSVSGDSWRERGSRRPGRHCNGRVTIVSPVCNIEIVDAGGRAAPEASNEHTKSAPHDLLSNAHPVSAQRWGSQYTDKDSQQPVARSLQSTFEIQRSDSQPGMNATRHTATHHGQNDTLSKALEATSHSDSEEPCPDDTLAMEPKTESGSLRNYLSTLVGPRRPMAADDVSLAASSGVFGSAMMPDFASDKGVPSWTRSTSPASTICSVEAQEMVEHRSKNHIALRNFLRSTWVKSSSKHYKKKRGLQT